MDKRKSHKLYKSPGDPFTPEWKRKHPNYKAWHDRFLMHRAAARRAAVERARSEIPLDDKHFPSVLVHDGGSESGAITIALPPGAVRALTKIPKGAR